MKVRKNIFVMFDDTRIVLGTCELEVKIGYNYITQLDELEEIKLSKLNINVKEGEFLYDS